MGVRWVASMTFCAPKLAKTSPNGVRDGSFVDICRIGKNADGRFLSTTLLTML